MPELLLVGVGRMGRAYLAAAHRLGVDVHAVELPERADGLAQHLTGLQPARGDLDELWAEGAWAAAVAGPPDGVLAFSEPQVLAAALLQDHLGLPGPSLHAAVLSRNKALQRGRFAAAGISQPEYLLTDSLAAAEEWAAPRLPVVLKPLSSAGSAGVELVADLSGYRAAAARRSSYGRQLVETAIDGPEYSWEALMVDGLVWFSNVTAKETTGPPNFVEIGHLPAAVLPEDEADRVNRFARAVIAALGMRTGVVHLEFRLSGTGPTLMEVAVRTPGDYLMDILGLTYGVDWYELAVRLALSMPLPEPPRGPAAYAASYFPMSAPGVVTRVDGVTAVQSMQSVVHAEVTVKAGDTVPLINSSAHRIGHVVLAAATRAERDHTLAVVRRTISVATEPVGGRRESEGQHYL
jgi:biotin carboxylase